MNMWKFGAKRGGYVENGMCEWDVRGKHKNGNERKEAEGCEWLMKGLKST